MRSPRWTRAFALAVLTLNATACWITGSPVEPRPPCRPESFAPVGFKPDTMTTADTTRPPVVASVGVCWND